ncbi:MAG: BrxA family protein [Candidatus Binatia bacterium]
MGASRSAVVSSFTIIKGSLIEETYEAFCAWNLPESKNENLQRIKRENPVSARSSHWLRDVVFVLSRRFDPAGRDRPLVELAKAGCNREAWKPLLLWHITRDEFLLRDFLLHWLYPRFVDGTYRLTGEDVQPYLRSLHQRGMIEKAWTYRTTKDVALSLLRIAEDFGLLHGKTTKEFRNFHLPDESFLYLLHAMADVEPNARRLIESEEWHMYLMDAADVEREIFRLHQFRKLHYEVAGSLAQLKLPYGSSADYVREISA